MPVRPSTNLTSIRIVPFLSSPHVPGPNRPSVSPCRIAGNRLFNPSLPDGQPLFYRCSHLASLRDNRQIAIGSGQVHLGNPPEADPKVFMHLRKAFVTEALAGRRSSVQLFSNSLQCFSHVGQPFFRFALVPHNIPLLAPFGRPPFCQLACSEPAKPATEQHFRQSVLLLPWAHNASKSSREIRTAGVPSSCF